MPQGRHRLSLGRAPFAILALCGAVGCGRIRFDPLSGGRGDGGDGGAGDSGGDGSLDAAGCTFGPWGTPRRITELATTAAEYGPQIAPDGLTLYFDRHITVPDEIFVATRPDRSSPFGVPMALPQLGTGTFEGSATVTASGLELYFETNRTGTNCIFRSTRATTAAAWGAPAAVAGLCGSPTDGPYVSPDGLTLVYNTSTPPTDYEGTIMVTQRASTAAAFTAGQPIVELQGGATKGYAGLSSDRLTLYFESSPGDIYETSRPDLGSPFGTPIQVPGINSSSGEQDVSISTDGLELFFGSNRPGSSDYDLYVASRSCI